ncbi:MAG TPA: hypothetical protein VFE05_19940 [Longimicrobiaceae bacterium]|jgi:hypothetical protein|nr:hypothetical protein [Longimicrobiaceae bacterium]
MRAIYGLLALLAATATAAAAQQTPVPTPANPDSVARADSAARADSIAAVRELEAAGTPSTPTTAENGRPAQAGSGGPTNPRLLPDFSAVGDLVGDLSPKGSTQPGGERFAVREVELAVQAVVDPYFRGDVFLGISDQEGISIEQAYLTTTSLPAGLEARLGRFLMPFGKQNTTHRHDLHTIEYPWVIQRFLSDDGLKGTGIAGSKVFSPFGFYQELQVTAVDRLGQSPDSLVTREPVNRSLGGLGFSARLRNYVDISQSTNFELSASAMTGRRAQPAVFATSELTAVAARQTTLGVDLTYRWRPLEQGLYKSFMLQGEFMRQINGDPVDESDVFLGPTRNYNGAYVFARYQVGPRSFIGSRYDWVQDPENDGDALNAVSGYLEFFPSEFSKLTAGYERYMPGGLDGVNRFLVQATFALGPHKPHPF